ncbi:MAG: ChbG/HpnK family deacetylase [Solirubrobacteraceae bacterium]
MTPRTVIVNADDFGASAGVNAGIVEAHAHGIVTSTSLMVTGRAATEAARLARAHPGLSVGLHLDLDGEDADPRVPLDDAAAVRAELAHQLGAFGRLLGRAPTHVDSHHHVHRRPELAPLVGELVAPLGVPLRGDGRVTYVGGFYAQWEWRVTELTHVSVDALLAILRDETGPGWTEIGCHPGRVTPDFRSVYLAEREAELATLTDARLPPAIAALDLRLAGFADLPRLAAGDDPGPS